MTIMRKKGNKNKYNFRDCDCLGRKCFVAGMFSHYNTSISGARSSTNETAECINRAYHGCNLEENPYDKELAQARKLEGWKCS